MPSFSVLAESEGFLFRQRRPAAAVAVDDCLRWQSTAATKIHIQTSRWSLNRLSVPPSSGQKIERSVMRKCGFLILACALFSGPCPANGGVTFQEDFVANPATRCWLAFGDSSLFSWNSTNQNLEVTWDSSRTNSFFALPLNTVLSRADDFSFVFDLRLDDIAVGTTPGKPFTFQLAIGFLNLAGATATNFLRGTGTDSPDLAEFDYFPDSGFGATVSPTIISSNVQFAYSFNPLALTAHDWFHVVMSYTASNQTLVTSMTRNGIAFGPIQDVTLGTNFTDFRADHFALSSYSDAGQDPQFAGSILAHGVVDNIVITVPDPAVPDLAGAIVGGTWRVDFTGRTNWLYTLERTEDFQSWSAAAPVIPGVKGRLTLTDTNATAANAYYRVRAERP